jgi:hypothetical protein
MKRYFGSSLAAITVLLAAGAVALPADAARAVSAFAGGRSFDPASMGCFVEAWGGIKNICAGTKSYEVSLPVDSPGLKTVFAYVQASSADSNVKCRAIAVGTNGTFASGTGFKELAWFGAGFQKLTLTGANVPSWGSLYLYCEVEPGGKISHVVFDQ